MRFSRILLPFIVSASLLSVLPAVCPGAERLPLDKHLQDTYTDDLPGLLERRYIRVLTTFNRTNYFIAGGRPYGFEYSLLKDYEKFLNKAVGRRSLKVVVEFIPVERDRLISGLREGLGDIAAAGLTITPGRKERADFTDPYLTGISEVVVAHRSVRGVEELSDLAGREVFVRKSSSYYESLRQLSRKLKKEGRKGIKVVEADENLETEDILELVNSGAVGLTVADSHIAAIWAKVLKDIRVREDLKIKSGRKIAWMIRKGSPELKASLNKFIRTRKKGTLLGNIYFNRYFRNTEFIINPLGRGERKRQERFRELFRKYGERYGFDWLLVMALAYQESGLDHGKRSRYGAVGIMQVRPDTARAVGIEDYRDLEGNIRAGVRYLARLRDRYFDDPGLRERDRIRLSLAAYNAGPTKIRAVRKRAARMGYDPDRWFRNVEYAALKYVGQEPVRYVSNINKYYVALRLYYRTEKERERVKLEAARD